MWVFQPVCDSGLPLSGIHGALKHTHWQTLVEHRKWEVLRGERGDHLKAACSSLKAAPLCFCSSSCFFLASCSWRISASNRLDSLMAWTCPTGKHAAVRWWSQELRIETEFQRENRQGFVRNLHPVSSTLCVAPSIKNWRNKKGRHRMHQIFIIDKYLLYNSL